MSVLRFIVGLFALIGVLVVLLVVAGGIAAYRGAVGLASVPGTTVLTVDLDRPVVEAAPDGTLATALLGRRSNLRDIIDALDRARIDPRVKGLVARLGADQMGYAQAQELRDAVQRFRDSGRFTVAYADSFGAFAPGNRSYYLATGFDHIWLQPVGELNLTGTAATVPFARGLLDTIGLDPQIEARGEYKTAPDTLTQRGFTDAHREMMESLVGDLYDQLVAGIATARKLDQATLKSLIDRAPLTGKDALDAKLIDRIGYYDEAKDQAIRDAGSGAAALDLLDYLDQAGRPDVSGPTIALIYGVGTIVSGDGEADPLLDDSIMASYRVVRAFDAAMADTRVRAIVFRIDSGGGSAVASETIRRAVLRAKAAGKPVIVSMSDLAGSGGYWIAMNADKIVAEPATLTGSIGAFAGKVATQGLWKDIGINWGTVSRGQNADMFSPITPFTPTEENRLKSLLDDLYATFTARVAEARNIPLAGVQQIAKGRVWTGSQAAVLGLVDKLGGLDTALVLARQAAGLGADAEITVRQFPAPRPAWQRALDALRGRAEAETTSATAARLAPVLRQLAPLVRTSGEPALLMPPLAVGP